jgi:hypothetical protein
VVFLIEIKFLDSQNYIQLFSGYFSKMSDQQNLISQFIEITGVEETRAKFYLESSGWDLNVSFIILNR